MPQLTLRRILIADLRDTTSEFGQFMFSWEASAAFVYKVITAEYHINKIKRRASKQTRRGFFFLITPCTYIMYLLTLCGEHNHEISDRGRARENLRAAACTKSSSRCNNTLGVHRGGMGAKFQANLTSNLCAFGNTHLITLAPIYHN